MLIWSSLILVFLTSLDQVFATDHSMFVHYLNIFTNVSPSLLPLLMQFKPHHIILNPMNSYHTHWCYITSHLFQIAVSSFIMHCYIRTWCFLQDSQAPSNQVRLDIVHITDCWWWCQILDHHMRIDDSIQRLLWRTAYYPPDNRRPAKKAFRGHRDGLGQHPPMSNLEIGE